MMSTQKLTSEGNGPSASTDPEQHKGRLGSLGSRAGKLPGKTMTSEIRKGGEEVQAADELSGTEGSGPSRGRAEAPLLGSGSGGSGRSARTHPGVRPASTRGQSPQARQSKLDGFDRGASVDPALALSKKISDMEAVNADLTSQVSKDLAENEALQSKLAAIEQKCRNADQDQITYNQILKSLG